MRYLFAVLLIATATTGAARAEPRTPLNLGDEFRLRTVSRPELAPDGRHVAYLETQSDVTTDSRRTRLMIVDADSGVIRAATDGRGSDSQPCWSSDGRLAYVASDTEGSHIVIVEADGTQRTVKTGMGRPQGLSWAPDGQTLAFIAATPEANAPPTVIAPVGATWAPQAYITETAGFQTLGQPLTHPMRYDLFVVQAKPGGEPKSVLDKPVAYSAALVHSALSWTPDGKYVLYAANPDRDFWRSPLISDVFAADVDGGQLLKLSSGGASDYGPVASPDNKTIAYLCWNTLTKPYIRHSICLFDRATHKVRSVPNGPDQRLSSLRWAADSKAIYGSFEERGREKIALFDLAGGYRVLAETRGGDLSAYTRAVDLSVSTDGSIAYIFGDATRPSDVALLRPGGEPKFLTAVNEGLLQARQLATVEEITYPSKDPRFQIQAVVTKPPGFDPHKRYPLFVYVHGGRSLDFGLDFDIEAQMIAAQGYVVVMPNYRGSGGFGTAFADNAPPYPTGTDKDVGGAVDVLVALGYIDPNRIFLGGGSGGGVITGWTIGHTRRFRAAAMWFATVDWKSNNLESAVGYSNSESTFGYLPWLDTGAYEAQSPLTFVGQVKTPTILVVGDQDRITPMSQSIMYFDALRFQGIPSQLQIVPGEPHGVDVRPSHELGLIKATLDWFARFGSGVTPTPVDLPAQRHQ